MNPPLSTADALPFRDPLPVISVAPLTVPSPGRVLPLEVRVSAPAEGSDLPIILLSHGHGPSTWIPSLYGYGPLAHFWASQGFVVIQPTHLSSRLYGLGAEVPGAPLFWRSRAEDMSAIIDALTGIEASVPTLGGRLDRERIAVAGHSMGGHTAELLLGMTLIDPETGKTANLRDPRITAGLLLAAPGLGGASLTPTAASYAFFTTPDFSGMSTPTLVVAGDEDHSPHLTVRGAAWHTDPYHEAPGPKSLFTVSGGKHGLGGIAGYDALETDDADHDRLASVQRMTAAYLRSALTPGETAWADACSALATRAPTLGRVEEK